MKRSKSPSSVWIEGMPKRLREHIRAKEIEWESEPAPLDWPCVKCGDIFTPKRNPLWWFNLTGEQYEKHCPVCQLNNLINGLCDTEEQKAEFRAALASKRT